MDINIDKILENSPLAGLVLYLVWTIIQQRRESMDALKEGIQITKVTSVTQMSQISAIEGLDRSITSMQMTVSEHSGKIDRLHALIEARMR